MDDARIIDLYFARQEQAITETDAKYGKLCYKISYNILQNTEDSKECQNDTYMGAWNAIPPTRPDNLMAFLCKISRNLALKRMETATRKKRSPEGLISFEELSEVLPDAQVPDQFTNENIAKLISDFLWTEKEEARYVFIRKYFFFDSVDDIARRFHFTESKVKSMLFHTRKRLKEYLIKEGVYL